MKSDHWKLDYWLGLNLQGLNRSSEAKDYFTRVGERADDPAFYISRANLFGDALNKEKDLRRAFDINSTDWRTAHQLITFLLEKKRFSEALRLSESIGDMHTGNYIIEMDHIQALAGQGHFVEANQALQSINYPSF